MSLFPTVQPEVSVTVERLPLAREVAWNFVRDIPIIRRGEPVFCEGA